LQVLTEREEKASIAVASNAPFSEWGQTFTDPRLAAAIVDRLTFNALIVETGSESYRLRATHSRKKGVPQAVSPLPVTSHRPAHGHTTGWGHI
jgi:DNA replication protein DnaC